MKHPVLALLGLLAVAAAPVAQAVEILRWERMPLAVPLKVGQERIVFIDRNVRVGVPAGVGERLRVQSASGAVYLRASEPIEPTRLQLQDADTGALILLDIQLPGMLVATVAHSPRFGGKPKSFDATAAKAVPGVVEHGLFLNMCQLALIGSPDGSVIELTRTEDLT